MTRAKRKAKSKHLSRNLHSTVTSVHKGHYKGFRHNPWNNLRRQVGTVKGGNDTVGLLNTTQPRRGYREQPEDASPGFKGSRRASTPYDCKGSSTGLVPVYKPCTPTTTAAALCGWKGVIHYLCHSRRERERLHLSCHHYKEGQAYESTEREQSPRQ